MTVRQSLSNLFFPIGPNNHCWNQFFRKIFRLRRAKIVRGGSTFSPPPVPPSKESTRSNAESVRFGKQTVWRTLNFWHKTIFFLEKKYFFTLMIKNLDFFWENFFFEIFLLTKWKKSYGILKITTVSKGRGNLMVNPEKATRRFVGFWCAKNISNWICFENTRKRDKKKA